MRDYLLSRRKLLMSTVAAAAAGSLPRLAFAEGKTIRYGDVLDRNNPEVITENLMAKKLKETAGFDAKVFPDSILGSHVRMNEQLRNGTLELTTTNVADLAGYDPRLGLFAMPFAFPDRKSLFAAEDGALGKAYAGILEQYGFVLLGWFDSGLRSVYNRARPIHTPDDLKGLKIRTMGNKVMIDTFNQLGAQATPLDTAQIYSALQQGVVDGAENSPTFFVQMHHNEVAKYFSYTNHFFSIDPILASKKWFDTLDAKTKDAVMQAAAQAQEHERGLWLASDTKYTEIAKKGGAAFNETDLAAFRNAVKPIYTQYRSTFGDLSRYLPDL